MQRRILGRRTEVKRNNEKKIKPSDDGAREIGINLNSAGWHQQLISFCSEERARSQVYHQSSQENGNQYREKLLANEGGFLRSEFSSGFK
ncbi:hypothetical protein CEXT_244771 [Caerostris extrusa]|uniref:Uncharacterized protein n=1 Tax=Caerostris extrusa TaxID=172846 RepID=A0AAV4QL60_CAEEX|nr:hypothetical protein CEXT_244771 [Caerostris extrusa]